MKRPGVGMIVADGELGKALSWLKTYGPAGFGWLGGNLGTGLG